MFENFIGQLREAQAFEPGRVMLHAPVFSGNEREYVMDAIDSTFVSSVGAYVDRFERMLEEYTGAARAVACVNGTAALEVALHVAGVVPGDYVVTQTISFVATANAISHAGGEPLFVDIDGDTLGLSPSALRLFLQTKCRMEAGFCILRETGRRIKACVPMHTFGLPCHIDEIVDICHEWNIVLVEDVAEALGSRYHGRHCGTFGQFGCISFNGNKTITTGGGGAVITDDVELGARVKHLTTTAKVPHPWEYRHDSVAWNFRMPNLNAALGCAQLERLDEFIERKRWRAARYAEVMKGTPWTFVSEPANSHANYWLCAILFNDRNERNVFLQESNDSGFMTRPVWQPINTMPMYGACPCGDISTAMSIADRLVNLPSGFGQ